MPAVSSRYIFTLRNLISSLGDAKLPKQSPVKPNSWGFRLAREASPWGSDRDDTRRAFCDIGSYQRAASLLRAFRPCARCILGQAADISSAV